MNYFNRLAQRTGIAPPGGAIAPITAPAASEIAPPVDAAAIAPITAQVASGIAPPVDAAAIEQMIEVAAPPSARLVTGAALVNSATSSSTATPAVIPDEASVPHGLEATALVTEAEGRLREEERILEASTPLRPRVLAREIRSQAPPPIAPDASLSQGDADGPSNVSARLSQDAMTAADPAAFAVEVLVQADTTQATSPDVKRQAPPARERRAPDAWSDLRSAEGGPLVDQEIALATRVVSIAGHTREERDGIGRQRDRAAIIERRPRAEEPTRGGPVEVRIGTVTLQVHAASDVPTRSSFAPHRHYLRLW